jgi:protein-L-isoaspartate(D-aspartate) O-methyltransferase
MDLTSARAEMLRHLERSGVRSPRVLEAMVRVPREEFVLSADRQDAYADRALPIGHGQTISQPLMVAIIVEALELQPDDRALDVGTGSGYQAALMAACGARVVTVERVPSLAREADMRLRRLGFEVTVVVGDGSLGAPAFAPFDAVAVAAAAPRLPVALARQLAPRGRLVVPISAGVDGEQLTRLRVVDGNWRTESLGPCRFVPLIGADAYDE